MGKELPPYLDLQQGLGGSNREMNFPERQFRPFPKQGSSAGTRH